MKHFRPDHIAALKREYFGRDKSLVIYQTPVFKFDDFILQLFSHSTAIMLCTNCLKMFENQDDIPMNYHDDTDEFNGLIGKIISNEKELENGAAQKCQLCLPLWNLILEHAEKGLITLRGNIVAIYSFHTLFYNNLLSIRYRVFGKGPHRFPDLESSVILWPQSGIGGSQNFAVPIESKKLLGSDEVASSDPVPTSRWPQIFKWIQECENDHARCPKLSVSDGSEWYPTRLLKILESGDSIKLVVTSIERPSTAYVTLSHRWGTEPMEIMTAENMEDFKNEIQVRSLPKTFQDAITVARGLGVRYLWIDSLCIMQSGESAADDWNRESVTMHRVYGNAFCNIAATSAPDPKTGLFLNQPAEVDPPATVTMNYKSHKKGGPSYIGDYTVINSDLWATVISRSPLMRRAWVFQERILAPRVLHFASSQVFWECCTQQACETFPGGLPDFSQAQLDRVFRPATRTSFWKQLQAEPLGPEVAHYRHHHDVWTSIVEDYSRCELTVEADKLVALSGVAQRVAEFHKKSEYIAGNWREDFPFCLLWYSEPRPGAALCFHPAGYRAPSWSWASYEGAVIFPPGPFDSMECDIVDISVSRAQLPGAAAAAASPTVIANETIESGSSITLVGHMISAHWDPEDSNTYERFKFLEMDNLGGFWYPDEPDGLYDHYEEPESVQFLCFAIHRGVMVSGDVFLMGITLVETCGDEGHGKQRYRRMGYFSTSGKERCEVVLGTKRREVVII